MMDKHNQFDPQQHSSQSAANQSIISTEDKLSPSLPQEWHRPPENGLKSSVYLSEFVEERSHLLLPLLGYGLLGFALFDYIHIVFPPRFTNPEWEFQTIGAMVEHVAAPLLGLLFVFYRNQGYIFKLEKIILGFLSWISLLVGLLYVLMVPLGVADTWRIYQANNNQIAAQVSQQSQQFQQMKGKLNQAKTDQQIKQLLASGAPQGRSPEIKNPQAFKDELLTQVSQSEQRMQLQANSARTNQRQALFKNSVKWNLGAVLAGTLFIWIWQLTDWARRRLD